MDDNFQQPLAALQIVTAVKTGNVLALAQGIVSLLGFETNKSVVEKLVARDFEDFIFESLMDLQKTSKRHAQRLLNVEATVDRLDFTADEFQKHIAEDLKTRMEKVEGIIAEWEDRLGPSGARPSDLVAVLEAGYRTWKSTADDKKRKLLGNALRNSFDPKQYEEGLTLRLLGILTELTYGDIWTLKRLSDNLVHIRRVTVNAIRTEPNDHHPYSEPQTGSLDHDQFERLKSYRLVHARRYTQHLTTGRGSERTASIPSELGLRLLALVAEQTSTQDPAP